MRSRPGDLAPTRDATHAACRRARRLLVVLAVAAVALLSSSPASSANLRVLQAEALEATIVERVNAVRARRGLHPLAFSGTLKTAAVGHVFGMARAGYFSHSWLRGVPFDEWIRWYWPGGPYRAWSAGENLFRGTPRATAAYIVRAWMGSAGHRANLLDRRWGLIGVGAVLTVNARGPYTGRIALIVSSVFGSRS